MTAVVSNSTEYLLGQSLSSRDDDNHNIYTNLLYLDTSSPGFNDPITFPQDPKERWVSLPDHFFGTWLCYVRIS